MSTPQEPKKKKRIWRRIVYVILALLLVYWFCFRGVPLRISPETTVLTEPRTADGKRIDYFKAIEALTDPKVPPEQNGFRNVAQAAGRVPFENINMEYWKQLCEKLNLDPHAPAEFPYYKRDKTLYEAAFKKLEITTPLEDEEKIKNRPPEQPKDSPFLWNRNPEAIQWVEQHKKKAMEKAWTGEENPLMEQYILEISPFLDLVAKAVREEIYYIPIVPQKEGEDVGAVLLPCVQSQREFMRDLSRRTYYYLGKGEKDKAINDLITIFRLGQHLKKGCFLVTRLVGNAIEATGYPRMADLLQNYELTREQYAKILEELEQLPKTPSLEPVYQEEQYMMLDVISCLSQKNYKFNMFTGEVLYDEPRYIPKLVWLNNYFGYDWNLVSRRANHIYQRNLDIFKEPDEEKRRKMNQEFLAELQWIKTRREDIRSYWRMLFVQSRSQMMGDGIGAHFCPYQLHSNLSNEIFLEISTGISSGKIYSGEAMIELLRLACALELYKFDEGRYPDHLEKLCDKYLKEIPDDPCADTKQPFRYRLEERQSEPVKYGYLLYSVGFLGTDSEGKTNIKINGLEDLYDPSDKYTNYPIRK